MDVMELAGIWTRLNDSSIRSVIHYYTVYIQNSVKGQIPNVWLKSGVLYVSGKKQDWSHKKFMSSPNYKFSRSRLSLSSLTHFHILLCHASMHPWMDSPGTLRSSVVTAFFWLPRQVNISPWWPPMQIFGDNFPGVVAVHARLSYLSTVEQLADDRHAPPEFFWGVFPSRTRNFRLLLCIHRLTD